ncbi:hypothetical protein TNCV_4942931 [Trichonephila clavipes]|nr:hypothetical protein TNCV_4942931 [Trichonephila clavipes]
MGRWRCTGSQFLLDEGAVDISLLSMTMPQQLPEGDWHLLYLIHFRSSSNFSTQSSAPPTSVANYKKSFTNLLGQTPYQENPLLNHLTYSSRCLPEWFWYSTPKAHEINRFEI